MKGVHGVMTFDMMSVIVLLSSSTKHMHTMMTFMTFTSSMTVDTDDGGFHLLRGHL